MTMTLDQFRASGRDVANLGAELDDECVDGVPGRVYAHEAGPYIERFGEGWLLTLGNCQFEEPLADLEARLYDWAVSEEII